MSSPPPASPPMVWPPSPSGTVIPFPLPWGQTGCCPPGGMDALMKCYCDIQQASAFIGQVMLDQINNNPAIIAAIIAGIEASGSSLPTVGVTNGQPAQPGQVGEFIKMEVTVPITTAAGQNQSVSLGILPAGDWVVWAYVGTTVVVTGIFFVLSPTPAGFGPNVAQEIAGPAEATWSVSPPEQALTSVPSPIVISLTTNTGGAGSAAGNATVFFVALRVR